MSNAFLSTVLVFKNILILSRLTYFGILFLYRWASFLESRFLHLLISTELFCIPAPRCLFVSVCTFPFPSYKLTLFVSMYSPGASRSLALGPAALSALAPGIGGLLACPPGGPDGQAVVGVRHRFYHAMSARTAACFRGLSGGRTARKGARKSGLPPVCNQKLLCAAGFGAKRPKSAAGENFFQL